MVTSENYRLVDRFLRRLEAVEHRLAVHAAARPRRGLTDPDPKTGERWDAGQIWAHLAEFLPYWIDQARTVLVTWTDEPVPFGRVKSDPARIAAIEENRSASPIVLMQRLRDGTSDLRTFLESLEPEAWLAHGRHSTLGIMPLARIVDEFMIGHLEEHAAQLDVIASRERS